MAMKQEQEPAKSEITEVAENVLRLELDISLPGLGHVNCYALVDKDGVALVDPGLPGPATYETLVSRLKQAQLAVKDIHTVIVTHSHPDHFGGAARLAEESGARVVGHEDFSFGPAPHDHSDVSVDDLAAHEDAGHSEEADDADEEAIREVKKMEVSTYEAATIAHRSKGTPWGGASAKPPFGMLLKWKFFQLIGKSKWYPTISHHVKDRDVLKLAGRDWFVVHTPGHTADHICLHDPENRLFLAGDHILPTITPHISGVTQRADPLNAFFESLDLVADTPDVENVFPAHGHPFDDLALRAKAIKQHHYERLDKLKSIGAEIGPSTVTDYMQELFRKRSWGAMAESETYAHLEHLRLIGDAECHESDDHKLIYSTG